MTTPQPASSPFQQLMSQARAPLTPMLKRGSLAAVALTLGLTTALAGTPSTTLAADSSSSGTANVQAAIFATAPGFQDTDSLVFTLGQLVDVGHHKVTLRLANGETQTFDIDDDTEVRGQDGDDQRLDDLDVGEMVVIVTEDDDNDALAIVEGGPNGFRQGGPYDLQPQADERGQWRQRAHPNSPAPFSPRQPGPAPADANQQQPGPPNGAQPNDGPASSGLPGEPTRGGMMPGPGAGGPGAGGPSAGGPQFGPHNPGGSPPQPR